MFGREMDPESILALEGSMGAGLAALLGGTSYTYLGGGLGGEGAVRVSMCCR